jgi:hypothetical protein
MTMLRILFGYGQILGLPNCDKVKGAHELGQPELALAQALPFEGTLRQIDVIGEWLPDPHQPSTRRWANGLLWQHIRDYVLVKDTTKTGQETSIDFKLYPLALAELQHVPQDQRVGPVIKDGRTGQPFKEPGSKKIGAQWHALRAYRTIL